MRKLDLNRRVRRKQAVLLHTIGGWTTNVFLIVQGLVMVPLYLHFLGDRLYGFWLASGGLLGWLSLVNVGADSITQQRCAAAYGRKDFQEVANYFWHGVVVTAFVFVVIAGCLVFLGLNVSDWLKIDPRFRRVVEVCFFLAGCGTLLSLANSLMRAFAAALQRNHVPLFSQAAGDLVCLVWIFLSLVVFRFGLYSLATGAVVRVAVPLVVNSIHTAVIVASLGTDIRWSRTVFADYLKTSPALLAAKSSGVFAINLPQVLIARLIGPEATVAYSITLRVVWILQNFINHGLAGLYAAFAHFFHDPLVLPENRAKLARKAAWTLVLASCTTLPLYAMFNQGFVGLWTSPTQFAGQFFTVLVAFASFLTVRSNFFVGFGNSIGRIREVQMVQTAEYLILAFLTVVGVFSIGLIGVPIARIVAALAVQVPVRKVLDESGTVLRDALLPLYWVWLPAAFLMLSLYPLSGVFVSDDWITFVLRCGLAAIPFGLCLVLGQPDLRSRFLLAARRVAPGWFRVQGSGS